MGKKIGIRRGYWQFFLLLLFLLFSAIAITSGCGSGDDSSSSTTNNGGGASGGGGGATVPAAPTLASVKCSILGGCCNLVGTWNSVSGAASYNIYYVIDPAYTPSPDVIKNTGTKIAGVSSGYTYTFNPSYHSNYYVVTAVNAAGESAANNAVYATCQ